MQRRKSAERTFLTLTLIPASTPGEYSLLFLLRAVGVCICSYSRSNSPGLFLCGRSVMIVGSILIGLAINQRDMSLPILMK